LQNLLDFLLHNLVQQKVVRELEVVERATRHGILSQSRFIKAPRVSRQPHIIIREDSNGLVDAENSQRQLNIEHGFLVNPVKRVLEYLHNLGVLFLNIVFAFSTAFQLLYLII
jgi:hypothetical protein